MKLSALVPLLLLLGGCVTDAATRKLTLEDEVMDADRAFAWDVQQRRLDAWVAAFDEHGSQVDSQGAPVTGHDAIRAYMKDAFADLRFNLEWAPVEASVPENGNLGFVWGRWTLRAPGAGGKTEESHGHYLDVWRKGADGKWKLLFDVGEGSAPKR
jgi:ketosteroid isomerase-like protein